MILTSPNFTSVLTASIRSDITFIKDRIDAIDSGITRMNRGVTKLVNNSKMLIERQENQAMQVMYRWLSDTNAGSDHSNIRDSYQEGTGSWFLDSPQFTQWVDGTAQTLFCPGIPGAGKTMIASIAIEEVLNRIRNDASTGLAFIYCNFQKHQEQTDVGLLAAILKQLVQSNDNCDERMKVLYNCHMRYGTRPSFPELLEIVEHVISEYSRVFIIIDALDECQKDVRDTLVDELRKLQHEHNVMLMASSRFVDNIPPTFLNAPQVVIRARNEDVESYLDSKIQQLPPFIQQRPELKQLIETSIIGNYDGM